MASQGIPAVPEDDRWRQATAGYACDHKLGRSSVVRPGRGRSGVLGGKPSRLAPDGVLGRDLGRIIGISDDHAADRSADAGADQTTRAVAISELPKHDQTVAERKNGTGNAGKMSGGGLGSL